jgi:hypothetical protein
VTIFDIVKTTEDILSAMHREAKKMLEQDTDNWTILDGDRKAVVARDHTFITVLNNAIDGCINWRDHLKGRGKSPTGG